MKNKMPEIQPCRYCNSSDTTVESYSYRTWFYVRCHSCGAKGPDVNDKPMAVTVWNKGVISE
ncbi:Lar family restriction alleviation protein [Providencia rettgeri]|uniref:Lar family restriction alleviation protein n=1 Tax=Providencia TaxID=586 RepID=UPI00234B267F|nr:MULTISPECIES: Lar family restriction alleviation protein [unclassified Providencia]MBZ3684050.1 Lar family restriction alleviation protein [Providencia rettgeri]